MKTQRFIVMKDGAAALQLTVYALSTEVRLVKGTADCAHLFSGRAHAQVALQNGRGTLNARMDADAAILTQCGRITAWGGFAGDNARLERAKLAVRLLPAPAMAEKQPCAKEASCPPGPKQSQSNASYTPDLNPFPPEATEVPEASCPPNPNPSPPEVPEVSCPPNPKRSPPEAEEAQSEALKRILRSAEMLFGPLYANAALQGPAPMGAEGPFIPIYSGAVWRRVNYPGSHRYYLEGTYTHAGMRYALTALPGEFNQPVRRGGFTRFARATDGSGWWISARRMRS